MVEQLEELVDAEGHGPPARYWKLSVNPTVNGTVLNKLEKDKGSKKRDGAPGYGKLLPFIYLCNFCKKEKF